MTLNGDRGQSSHYVFDASALLALLNVEPGGSQVLNMVEDSVISSVNWSEVLQKSVQLGMEIQTVRGYLESLGIAVAPFDSTDAYMAAELWSVGRSASLSFADRACLSLAQKLGLPAVTADRRWANLNLPAEVRLIR